MREGGSLKKTKFLSSRETKKVGTTRKKKNVIKNCQITLEKEEDWERDKTTICLSLKKEKRN